MGHVAPNSSGGGIARGTSTAGSGTNAAGGPAAHANIPPQRAASKYEVRSEKGKLLGVMTAALPHDGVVYLHSMKPISYTVVGPLDVLSARTMRLRFEEITVRWVDGSLVPTVVLREGKPSWLKHIKTFWRT